MEKEEREATILIVEDDPDVVQMLGAYFQVHGYRVFSVNYGERAIEQCQKEIPDLVILDIRLPDINGFEVARRLRTNQRTAQVPIIYLTERTRREDRLEGLSLGADDYITKPFDIQELRLRVRNAITRAQKESIKNPITGLPEGPLVDEKLTSCLEHEGDQVVLVLFLSHLESFRDQYGFVAADDVMRAISLIIENDLRAVGQEDDFYGHLKEDALILITRKDQLETIQSQIRERIEETLAYFYPLADLENKNVPKLSVEIKEYLGEETFETLDQFKTHLLSLNNRA
jgi:DNA-binding response OmpR family regulator